MSKKLTIVGLFLSSIASAKPSACVDAFVGLEISPAQFASSAFGLVHAERPGQSRYSKWSAATANEVLSALVSGKTPGELFDIGVRARQDFARRFENVERPEEDFGAPRVQRSRHFVGEDMMGLSSRTLKLSSAQMLTQDFNNWPNQWWQNIARNESRTRLADAILERVSKKLQPGDKSYNLLIEDRHYLTSEGNVLKCSCTKLQRANPDVEDSPYFVSTLNVPKPEIAPMIEDVYRRINLALKSKNRNEAREQLAHAMYGFFNAMPYYRGSAAIGRIVFTALFTKIEKRPVVIDPECDIKALISTQAEFVGSMAEIVR